MEQYALIVGTINGLGLVYAKWFTGGGCHLIITGRRKKVIERRAGEVRNTYGYKVIVILADPAEETGVNELLNQLEGKAIDILVDNAGFGLYTEFVDTDATNIKRLVYLQTTVVVRITHRVLGGMGRERRERTINVSSNGTLAVVPKNVVYAATERFIVTLTEELHMELTGYGIHVQAVCPGFIDSDFHGSTDMKVDRNRKEMFAFHRSEDVARETTGSFAKGKVVCIPGRTGKLIEALADLLPKRTYYRMAGGFAAESLQKGGKSLQWEQ